MMSGVEALAILGIACNVMQVISFSHETIASCKKYYETGCADPALSEAAGHLKACAKDLESQLQSPRPRTKDQEDLVSIAKKCYDISSKLDKELKNITSVSTSSNMLRSARLGVTRMLRKSRIEALEKDMSRHQAVLETSLISQV
jgi:hypothetical protein